MPDDDQDDALAAMWSVTLEGVQRLDVAEPDDDGETYMADFELLSPGANGTLSLMVGGGRNETHMIGQAREILQAALERWARVMASSRDAERTEPEKG